MQNVPEELKSTLILDKIGFQRVVSNKKFLIVLPDKNQLCLNYSEIDDDTYQVSEEENFSSGELNKMK